MKLLKLIFGRIEKKRKRKEKKEFSYLIGAVI
jgi:hypothetical protein